MARLGRLKGPKQGSSPGPTLTCVCCPALLCALAWGPAFTQGCLGFALACAQALPKIGRGCSSCET